MSARTVRRARRATVPVWERRPLTDRSKRLLLDGDVHGRYAGRNESEAGYRLTAALALACSQPGRRWTPADFHEALLYSPTAGGWWARKLRERKGGEYAETKLTAILHKARRFADTHGTITGRQDATEHVVEIRRVIESLAWRSRGGGAVDLKNLSARLTLCERSGGTDHTIAVRPLAEAMGCARSTAEQSNGRLEKAGWIVKEAVGRGQNHGTRWRLQVPPAVREFLAGADSGQSLTPHPPLQLESVPDLHTFTDTAALAEVMAHDACHHRAHGTSGARLLACLDPTEGLSPAALHQATTLHRTTISRHLKSLVASGLAREREGLYYLAPELAGPVRLHPDDQALDQAAEQHGTTGTGERRRARHARERTNYQRWLTERTLRHRRPRPRPRLVPEGIVDPTTGELLDERWRGWDTSDPARPVWLTPGAIPLPNQPTPAQAA
ncbi:helix-turn-helix domain-containing protein [Streptomyces violascens]|uniref:helix-turn-helix domain-containing protein n=1 Tax=Streptomyces violascens TaxID=67381 RepID=UPI0016746EE4|nr:helix-turn-helix domain-containing protein [Streptomyces violascens]GGU39291.1 hypothetical protein GCM10010289_70270 [Streptomyces violascens]